MKGITVLVLTFNEEANLLFALGSCQFVDQIFVLDSGSTDRTRAIAEEYGAHFQYHRWAGYARQKNWALDNLPITGEWVFILDADEAITPELREELISISTGRTQTDKVGYFVNRYFVWNGQKIRHCGYYPSWNLRYFMHGKAHYEEREVHEHMIIDGPVGYLKGEMRHEDRRGREYIWKKHLRYAELEAREMIKVVKNKTGAGLKPSFFGNSLERRRAIKESIWPHLPAKWLLRFLYMYFLKFGFMDGSAGLDMCIFISRYEREISKKYSQLKKEHA